MVVPQVGAVVGQGDASVPWAVVDAARERLEPVQAYLLELGVCDYSPLTLRSYAVDLLRWFRFLAAVGVDWDRAHRDQVRDFVLWLRGAVNPQRVPTTAGRPVASINAVTGKVRAQAGYAPATINHALSVIRAFYEFHLERSDGPLVNPVPKQGGAAGRPNAHHNPMEPWVPVRRAPLRQRQPVLAPRALTDAVVEALFGALTSDRDRALVATAVSSGARAAELLGMRVEHLDVAGQLVGLIGKGDRRLEWVPASPQAFSWTAGYLRAMPPRERGEPLWQTTRRPYRPLAYPALRQVLARANAVLGADMSWHDLRHTYAMRLVEDRSLSLLDVQTLMRHRSLSSTQVYLRARPEDLVERMAEHYANPPAGPCVVAEGYDPADLAALFRAKR